ncbi:hypothetical protein F5Y19DRAFT_238784 [Xylariaceae sp. FL1651]|nr:hypothetical protein F5Y19DRAFT_238784 [Xylariaceae sp. FL1651]
MRDARDRGALALAFILFMLRCWAVEFTTSTINISPGKPFTLTWKGATGPVEISLLTGPSDGLVTVEVIDSGDTSDSYTWTPPDNLPSGTYAFGISDGDLMNYSEQWTYTAGDNAPESTSTPLPTTTHTPTSTSKAPTTTAPSTTTPPEPETSSSDPPTTVSSTSPELPTAASSSSPESSSVNTSTSSTSLTASSSRPPSSESSAPADASVPTGPSSSSGSPSTKTTAPAASGLSTGAKAGIGVGAGVGALVLLSVAGLLIFRRGKAAGQRASGPGNMAYQEPKAELGGDPRPRAELGGQGAAGMHPEHDTVPELWQGHYDEWRMQPSELEASGHSYRGVDLRKV